jgi:hypothetical protein
MPSQPIGYVEPAPGQHLALGLADPLYPAAPVGPVLLAATPTPDTPNPTDSYLGGTIFTGFGQAPAANSSARLRGLNAT